MLVTIGELKSYTTIDGATTEAHPITLDASEVGAVWESAEGWRWMLWATEDDGSTTGYESPETRPSQKLAVEMLVENYFESIGMVRVKVSGGAPS